MSTNHTNLERFIITYASNLRAVHGGDEQWLAQLPAELKRATPEETFKVVATKIATSLAKGTASKEPVEIERTCEQLGVKHTYAAISRYLNNTEGVQPGDFYVTTYCNCAHRIIDGQPIGHNCFVLPPGALIAERDGDFPKAKELLNLFRPFRQASGVKAK